MGPETEGVIRESSVSVPIATAKVRIEGADGYVYEAEFYEEDDWPLEAALSVGVEEVDVTPPEAEWAHYKSGRKTADLRLTGLAKVVRLGPVEA